MANRILFGLHSFIDCAVVRDIPDVAGLLNAWVDNIEFIGVFENLHFKFLEGIIDEPFTHGSDNYQRIFLLAEDILYMLKTMDSCTARRHADEKFLTWKEIFNVLFDECSRLCFVQMISHLRDVMKRIIFDRFRVILQHDIWRKLPEEIWEMILIKTLRDNHGGSNFQMPTINGGQEAKEHELRILYRLFRSMAHVHLLLSRVLFLGRYVNCGHGILSLHQNVVVKSTEIRHHFDLRKRMLMRDVCQLFFHIREDGNMYVPLNLPRNIISAWNGCYKTSTYACPISPIMVAFCDSVSPLVALVSGSNFWDENDWSYATVTVYDMEREVHIIRIRVPIRFLRKSWRKTSFHLSPHEVVFVQTKEDEHSKPAILQWRFDANERNTAKFGPDQRILLPSHLQFPENGYVAFADLHERSFICICRQHCHGTQVSSKILLVDSNNGENDRTMFFRNKALEILGARRARMLMLDSSNNEVHFYDLNDCLSLWSERFPDNQGGHGSVWAKFDGDVDSPHFIVIAPKQLGRLNYQVWRYEEVDGRQPVRIVSGFMPTFVNDLMCKSAQLLNGCLYFAHSYLFASFCDCGNRKAVTCHQIMAVSLDDGAVHPLDCVCGQEMWAAVTAVQPCFNHDCRRYVILNEGNSEVELGFNVHLEREVHFKNKHELLILTSCWESGVAVDPKDFLRIKFSQ